MESKKHQKANSHSGKDMSIIGVVALDHVIILPTDACDESVEEAVDILVYALNYYWMKENEPQY